MSKMVHHPQGSFQRDMPEGWPRWIHAAGGAGNLVSELYSFGHPRKSLRPVQPEPLRLDYTQLSLRRRNSIWLSCAFRASLAQRR